MCGISGIIKFDNTPVQQKEIEQINNALSHRGPDNEGYWFDRKKSIALGHRRLSILDLSESANLPMTYKNRYHITYNGEIFNFVELKNELINDGYLFKTKTDTEVILAAYDKWGKNMLNKFNGMWSFAIFDSIKNELFLSRDRFGIKPLYYYHDKDKFIFASETQAINKYLAKNSIYNKEVFKNIAIGHFDSFGTEYTYLKNVFSLPGGYNLTLKDGKIKKEKWYSLSIVEVPKTFNKQAEVLRKLIIDACNLRLRSDVPIGTCLSGGVDSGSITSIISSKFVNSNNQWYSNYSHKSFCATFPNTPIDESQQAQNLASILGSKLDIVKNYAPSPEELEKAMKQCDGPMHSLAFLPIWRLYKYIKKQNISVTLDGQGPDEMLGGYSPILEALKSAWELRNPIWFFDVYKTYSSQGESKQSSSKKRARKILKSFIRNKILYIPKWILFKLGLYDIEKIKTYYTTLQKKFIRKPSKKYDFLTQSLFNQFFNSPLPSILQQYERCSMAHSVECRMPFMDYRIVEFVFSLPVTSKVGKGYTKRILREAMKGILPDETRLNKVKIGFNAPIVDWFRGSLRNWMLEQMNQPEFLNNPFFNGKKILYDFQKFLIDTNPQWNDAWNFWGPVHIAWWMKRNRT